MNKIDKNIIDNLDEFMEKKVYPLESLLKDARNEYEKYVLSFKNNDFSSLLERIVSAEKDLKIISDKFEEIKNNMDNNVELINNLKIDFQELSGSVNQLKLIIDEFKESNKIEKENKTNFIFQIIIPIILAIIFFLSGLFYKSCTAIHNQNIKPNNKINNSYEYKNFEPISNK